MGRSGGWFLAGLRQDKIRWARENRAELYIDLLAEAHAAHQWMLKKSDRRPTSPCLADGLAVRRGAVHGARRNPGNPRLRSDARALRPPAASLRQPLPAPRR